MRKALATIAVPALLLPSVVTAAPDYQAQIDALLKQIGALQAQLQIQRVTPDAPSCLTLPASITKGSIGDTVSRLQVFLGDQGPSVYPEAQVTGYYGTLTEAAVNRWQYVHHLPVTGVVDDITRASMGCASQTENNGPAALTPVITMSANMTVVAPNDGTILSWKVTHAMSCTLSNGAMEQEIPLSGSKLVIPTKITSYTITCANGVGNEVRSNTQSVKIDVRIPKTSHTEPSCKLTASTKAPALGSPVTLSWTSKNVDSVSPGYQYENGNTSIGGESLEPRGSEVVIPTQPTIYSYSFYGNAGYVIICRVGVIPQ